MPVLSSSIYILIPNLGCSEFGIEDTLLTATISVNSRAKDIQYFWYQKSALDTINEMKFLKSTEHCLLEVQLPVASGIIINTEKGKSQLYNLGLMEAFELEEAHIAKVYNVQWGSKTGELCFNKVYQANSKALEKEMESIMFSVSTLSISRDSPLAESDTDSHNPDINKCRVGSDFSFIK